MGEPLIPSMALLRARRAIMSVISLFPDEMLDNAPPRSNEMATGSFPTVPVLAIQDDGGNSDRSSVCESSIKSRQRERDTCCAHNALPTSIWSARHDGSTAFADNREFPFNHPLPFPNESGMSETIHPDDLPSTLARWFAALRTGHPFHDVHRGKRQDGQYERVLVDGISIRDEDGGIVCWIGARTSISGPEGDRAKTQQTDTYNTGSKRPKQTPDEYQWRLNEESGSLLTDARLDSRTSPKSGMDIPRQMADDELWSPSSVESNSGIEKNFLETVSAAADAVLSQSPQSLDPRLFRDAKIKALLRDLASADRIQPELSCLYSHSLCVAVLARIGTSRAIGRSFPQRRSIAPLPKWRLARVIQYIGEHLEDPIKLADLAKAAGLTRMHFAAQFRASVGISPHEYLLRRRIKSAQMLLQDPKHRLVDVALSVGFQAQPHFTTVFRRFVGMSPHRWRLSQGPNIDGKSAPAVTKAEFPPQTVRKRLSIRQWADIPDKV
jgi:AraC-like DNA-binding protein